jgi:DNA-binding LacI/PurR family transcriptional regulator
VTSPPPRRSPVELALKHYGQLLSQALATPRDRLPSERELAARWGLSQAAVNRAAQRLLAAGRLRREGYRLFPVPDEHALPLGAKIVALTQRDLRFPGLSAEAVRLGLHMEERFFLGRDELRQHLQAAAAEEGMHGVLMSLGDSGWEWDSELEELERRQVACVVCDEAPSGASLAGADWRQAGRLLVSHLAAQGHVELVLLGSMRRAQRTALVREGYEETCLRLRLGSSAERCVEAAAHTPDAVEMALVRIRRQWPEVTAVVVHAADILPHLLSAARRQSLHIPDDLSVVCAEDSSAARSAHPPVTCAAFDRRAHGQLALDVLARDMRQMRRLAHLPSRQRLRIEPTLAERQSVRPMGSAPIASRPFSAGRAWSRDRATRLHEAEDLRLRPHRVAGETKERNFQPIDLRPLANRSLTRQNGWLGHQPLLHLHPGRATAHGVPFEIIDERANHGAAAIVLRSQRPLTREEKPLPVTLSVPVGKAVRAVYFLHGCGYAAECQAFAWYDFILEGRRPISVPVVARGLSTPSRDALPPNIQDWLSDFPQFEAEGVKHFAVTAAGDPFEYERYLYTLEWENPRPRDVLREIRLSSNPALATTLGVLAITLVLA